MKRMIWIAMVGLCLNAGNIWGQDKADLGDLLPEGMVVFEPRYISDKTFREMMKVLDIRFTKFQDVNDKVYVKFRDKSEADRAKRLMQKIDVPPKKIGLRLDLVLVTSRDDSIGKAVDAKVLAQLNQVFKFKNYRVLSSGYLTVDSGQEGEMSLKGVPVNDRDTGIYNVAFEPKFIDDGKGMIKLEDFEIERDMGYKDKIHEMTILETTLNIKNGNTVIVGSTNIAEQVYITIVSASVVE